MKKIASVFLPLLMFVLCPFSGGTTVRLRITDESNGSFPSVLVIVKSLEGRGEIFRALTDSTGRVPERDLTPGLYRVIATCPYGICRTKISEFLVRDNAVEVELKLGLLPTQGDSTIVGPTNPTRVKILDAHGKPAPTAEILVRDSNAEFEQWYKTNGEGEVDVEPLGTTITFVVLFKGTLTTKTDSMAALDELKAEGKKLVIHLQ